MRYLILILIAFLLFFSKKYNNKKMLYLSAIILIFYSAFRAYIPGATVGNDYNNYRIWYNDMSFASVFTINNFLFNVLFYTIKVVFNNYDVFIFISSFFLICSVYYFSIKLTEDDRYALAVFVFLSFGIYDLSMSAIRQWIAGSIFLISLKQLKDKNLKNYIILIIIAALFHNSAIILLLVYPAINCELEYKKKLFLELIITILIYLGLYFKLDIYMISLIDKTYLLKYLNTKDGALYANYTVFIISTFCFLLMIIQNKTYKEKIKNYHFDFNYIVLLIIASLLATKSALACRFQQYFMPALMLVIPGIIKTFDGILKKIIYVAAILFLLLIYIL